MPSGCSRRTCSVTDSAPRSLAWCSPTRSSDLGLAALTVRVLEFNARAIACYARCGYVFDRREPDAVTLDGVRYADVIMRLDAERYARLAPSWGAVAEPPELF